MGLETGTYINDLVITNPPGGDDKRQGDDHLRLIKTVLKNTIQRGTKALYVPGVVTKTANYTVLDTDENLTFVCDSTSAAFTLTLPVLTSDRLGWQIRVVKTNSGTNPIYVMPASGTINGYSKIRRTIENTMTVVEWIGSWVATRPNGGAPIGSVVEYYGSTLPNGHLWAAGAAFTAADYVELNTVLGVALAPDRRGRAAFGRDDMGGSAASRVTLAGFSIVGTTLQAGGGAQNVVVAKANLATGETLSATGLTWGQSTTTYTNANYTFTGNDLGNFISASSDWLRNTGSNNVAAGAGASDVKTGGNFGAVIGPIGTPTGTVGLSTGIAVSMAGTIGGTMSTGGSGDASYEYAPDANLQRYCGGRVMRSNLEDNLARRVRHIASRFGSTEVTLVGEYSVSPESGSFHFLNTGGTTRTVRMPEIEVSGGQLYVIINKGSVGDLELVTQEGVAVTTLNPGRSAFVFSSATEWQAAIVPEVITPENAEYIVGASDPNLSNERVLTDTATVSWDLTTPGIAKANTVSGGGNVSNSGTPQNGDVAQWVDGTHIAGVTISTLGLQPLDGDLTALAALTGTNTIYYRSASEVWTGVSMGPNMSFTGGVLDSTVSGGTGNVIVSGTPTLGQLAQWTDATHVQGIAASILGYAPLASPTFTGDPQAPTPLTADNDTSIATTAYVKTNLTSYALLLSPTFTGTPQAPTPTFGDNTAKLATTAFVQAATAGAFPTGTLMLFQQTSAPTGWTKQVTHNDKTLRVVSGTASSGGTSAFSTVFGKTATDATTLTTAEMPSHAHDVGVGLLTQVGSTQYAPANLGATGIAFTASTGGGGSHTHPIDIRVQYVDLIIASKN